MGLSKQIAALKFQRAILNIGYCRGWHRCQPRLVRRRYGCRQRPHGVCGLKIAPTVPLSPDTVTRHVQDWTSDCLVQALGSGSTGAQLAEKPPNNDPGAVGLAMRVTEVF